MNDRPHVKDINYFELLAWLGIGSSHPGGFLATKQNLEELPVPPGTYVLDAGCGTGLTACYLAKTKGCTIIGIDLNPQMIEKAMLRAKKEGVSDLVEFRVADVYNLPFPDGVFDVVIGESITVFLDKVRAYKEFYRVLKPEGHVADLEMAVLADLPEPVKRQMEACFGLGTNPLSYDGWQDALSQAGFHDVEIKNPQPLRNNSNELMSELKKDWLLLANLVNKVYRTPGVLSRLRANANFTNQYRNYFGFGLIYGRKPTPAPQPSRKLRISDWAHRQLRRLFNP